MPRYAPDDFVDGARLDERFAWPVSYEQLVPYYEMLEPAMGLTIGDPILGVPTGRAAYEHRLASDWRRVNPSSGTRPRRRHPSHGEGSSVDARASRNRVLQLPLHGQALEGSASFRLITGAYVQRLVRSPSAERVTAVEYVDRRTGARQHANGRAVVLAAGAIDSTVIVLRSTSDDFPDGLGNSSGLVGRYLHDHPRECGRSRWVRR